MDYSLMTTNENDILFFDIETVRKNDVLDVNSHEFSSFRWKFRDKDTDELLTVEETQELYNKKGALHMCYNKIVCISVGYIVNNEVRIKSIIGEESEIIAEFASIANKFSKLCGYNVLVFDLPMIMTNGIKYYNINELFNHRFNTSGKQRWAMKDGVIDLMDIFRGSGFANPSMDEVCMHFGLPTPKDDIKGSDISRVYYEEENGIIRIAKYCNKDVFGNINIYRSMLHKPIFETFTEVNLG